MAARLADLLVGLSRLADLGFGLESGAAVRSCALATRFAQDLDLPPTDVRATYYTSLLHHVGCAGFAHETARLFGDDLATNRAAARTDSARPWDIATTFLPTLTRGRPPLDRVRLVLTAVTTGGRWGDEFTAAACEVARESARRMDLPADVQESVFHVYDRWRGTGRAGTLRGDDIPVAARIARLAGIAVLFESLGGPDLATQAVRRRSGGMLDPGLVARFAQTATRRFTELDETDTGAFVLDAEPAPHVTVADVCRVAEVFADLADLKSPYLLGHSRAVAAFAVGAAQRLRLPDPASADLRLAGLLHDVGRVAVSNAVWDKAGRLSTDEWEQLRLHPYYSERILAASAELAVIAPLVGRHHERLDGTGYHRGCTAADLGMSERVLAAADAYRTRTEPRPHRQPMLPEQVERALLDDARRGALDADAVRAVLATAGHSVTTPRAPLPRGLSVREAEVLRLVAQGCSNAEVAARLVISRRTAEHHVQHIYAKIGVSSRAAAAMFAIQHQLIAPDR